MGQPHHAKRSFYRIGLALLIFSVAMVSGAQQTIRIRFLNGKSGKPLRWKYPTIVPSTDGKVDYVFNKTDRYAFEAVIKNARTISLNQGYYRCDSARENDPAAAYQVEEIVEHGAVSANFCGSSHVQPVKGELILYTRHAHWWEMFRDIGKGLLICA